MSTTTTTAPAVVLDRDAAHVKPLIDTIRTAVNGGPKYGAYVKAMNVTKETVKDHAYALAVAAYPNEKPVQKVDGKRTKFGNAVQAAGFGLRSALGKADPAPVDYLTRVIKAVEAATSHEVDADTIREAVESLLGKA